ncbi:hypothetical protein BBJ29_001589 [Phytophthora kernoviae]|uniref:Uncharacterized protein n=2 Tax=Phytophthora kernoviae TaxID=325452 RepID=A0A3R7KJ89_9STRA|nr:hypothetical protein BBJ29_001589 [Phytophthora kernoviae]
MGNDGGVIAVKRKFMRHANIKARSEKADQEALRQECTRTCALSSEPLREPVVACKIGNLYNKQAVLEHLLAHSMPERFQHVTSLKDVVTCRVSYEKGAEDAPWSCPITMMEFNGKQPFVVLFSCGCVLSERALKAVTTTECLVCGKPFKETDVVTLLPSEEEYEAAQKQLMEKRAKKNKKKKTKNKEGDQEEKKKQKQTKNASEIIHKNKEKSQVFASLFSKDKKEKASANDLLMTIGGMRYTLS